jgi:hypothetical protein
VVSVTDPYGRILEFLDRTFLHYFFKYLHPYFVTLDCIYFVVNVLCLYYCLRCIAYCTFPDVFLIHPLSDRCWINGVENIWTEEG